MAPGPSCVLIPKLIVSTWDTCCFESVCSWQWAIQTDSWQWAIRVGNNGIIDHGILFLAQLYDRKAGIKPKICANFVTNAVFWAFCRVISSQLLSSFHKTLALQDVFRTKRAELAQFTSKYCLVRFKGVLHGFCLEGLLKLYGHHTADLLQYGSDEFYYNLTSSSRTLTQNWS